MSEPLDESDEAPDSSPLSEQDEAPLAVAEAHDASPLSELDEAAPPDEGTISALVATPTAVVAAAVVAPASTVLDVPDAAPAEGTPEGATSPENSAATAATVAPAPAAPVIFGIPGAARAGFGHLILTLFLAGAGLAVAVDVGDDGSSRGLENAFGAILFFGAIAVFAQILAGFVTIASPKPAGKALVFFSGLPFAIAALACASVVPDAIGRGASVRQMMTYPSFVAVAALFSGTGFLCSAIALRTSLVKLLALPEYPIPSDEDAESRGMLASLGSAAAAGLVVAALLLLRLPLRSALAFFLVATLIGGSLAKHHGRAAAALRSLPRMWPPSPLEMRLVPRLSLLPAVYAGAMFLLGLGVAMSVRGRLLQSMTHGRPVLGAAGVDRSLLILPFLLALVATSSFWLPALLVPSKDEAPEAGRPARSRFAPRFGVALAVFSFLLLLRTEDLYERRVGPSRAGIVAIEERTALEEESARKSAGTER